MASVDGKPPRGHFGRGEAHRTWSQARDAARLGCPRRGRHPDLECRGGRGLERGTAAPAIPDAEPLGTPVAGRSVRVASASALLNMLADDDGSRRSSSPTGPTQSNQRRGRRATPSGSGPGSPPGSDLSWFAPSTVAASPSTAEARHRSAASHSPRARTTRRGTGFRFANGEATDTGVIVFGGYAGAAAPHHITLRAVEILGTCTGHNDRNEHAIYFSYAVGGPHDILIDGLSVGRHGAATAVDRPALLPLGRGQRQSLEHDRARARREAGPSLRSRSGTRRCAT